MKYLALIRGINVGGKAVVKMAELKLTLERAGLRNVHTYIQSGNVLFDSPNDDQPALAATLADAIKKQFNVTAGVVVLNHAQWKTIITSAPQWWGKDPAWKHNLLILLPPYDMSTAAAAVGALQPNVETVAPGPGVLYQSMSKTLVGQTTTGKLASNPLYQRVTVRNRNTALKLLTLF